MRLSVKKESLLIVARENFSTTKETLLEPSLFTRKVSATRILSWTGACTFTLFTHSYHPHTHTSLHALTLYPSNPTHRSSFLLTHRQQRTEHWSSVSSENSLSRKNRSWCNRIIYGMVSKSILRLWRYVKASRKILSRFCMGIWFAASVLWFMQQCDSANNQLSSGGGYALYH